LLAFFAAAFATSLIVWNRNQYEEQEIGLALAYSFLIPYFLQVGEPPVLIFLTVLTFLLAVFLLHWRFFPGIFLTALIFLAELFLLC
jgi:hypothetical protein